MSVPPIFPRLNGFPALDKTYDPLGILTPFAGICTSSFCVSAVPSCFCVCVLYVVPIAWLVSNRGYRSTISYKQHICGNDLQHRSRPLLQARIPTIQDRVGTSLDCYTCRSRCRAVDSTRNYCSSRSDHQERPTEANIPLLCKSLGDHNYLCMYSFSGSRTRGRQGHSAGM